MFKELIYHKNKSKEIFLYVVIFFFPLSLVSGPFIPDLIVVLISLFSIFLYFKKYKKNLFFNNFIKILLIFYVYIFLNSFFSSEKFLSLKSSIPFFRFIIFAAAISFLIQFKKFKYAVYYSFLFLYLILFFDSLFQLYFQKNILGFPLINDRLSSFFGEELILGSFISKTVAILLFLIFDLKLDKKFFHYFLITSISVFLVILSAERTSLLVLLIIIFFSLFYLKTLQILSAFFVLVSLILGTLYFNENTSKRLLDHTLNQIVLDGKFNYPSYRHQLHYLSAFEIFKDHKIFGSGIKTFRELCKKDSYSLKDKIAKDNQFKTEFSGIYISGQMNDGSRMWVRIFKDESLENPLFQSHIISRYGSLDYYQNSLKEYGKKNPTMLINQDNLFVPYVKNFQKIKKDQIILSKYEFKNGCNTHPHNFYFQFLSELGIIGLLFLIGSYIFVIYMICKKLMIKFKKNELSSDFILYSSYLAVLFPFIPSGNFFNNYLCLLIFLPLCMYKLCYTK